MRFGISTRLFIAILASAVVSVVVVSIAGRWNFERSFVGYLDELANERMQIVLPRLAQAYRANGGWAFLDEPNRPWYKLLRPAPEIEPTPGTAEPAQESDLTGALSRLGLVGTDGRWLAGYQEGRGREGTARRRAVIVDGQTVGFLVLAPIDSVAGAGGARFARDQLSVTVAIAALVVVLAALIAWWVARRLLAPVRHVAMATHALAAGHHAVRVAVPANAPAQDDEITQLGRDFNQLAGTIQRNEEMRRFFLADVSHELRTPLAVLRGELEALEDGVRPLNPAAVRSLQGEVAQLGRLVDDLYELALSDAGALSYRMKPVDLRVLLQSVAAAHAGNFEGSGLRFEARLSDADRPSPAVVRGDPRRLQQLFDNLLSNSRRYTDPPGRVQIALAAAGSQWAVEVADSAPSVPGDQLPRLFERFFRVEASRSRATGGAGLGLAISRNVVIAHGGSIEASASSLGGLAVRVLLPAIDPIELEAS